MLKRFSDLLVSLAGHLVLLPLFVLVAVLVRLTSPGPVFFTQDRVGRNGRLFRVVKFRTMTVGADRQGSITAATDARITGIGRVLRRFKLDELPQLWNVLIGNMSFVGPRPDVPGYADTLGGEDRKVLALRPGITGPASLFFRSEEELLARVEDAKKYNDEVIWPVKVAINRIYREEWTFWKDIGYMVITVAPFMDRAFGLMRRFEGYEKALN
ncbi:MAG: sugar transferase [Chitinispirillaceae bacterium]|nr:sugar transferase [Chitinispirillaceae bacterium]